MFHTRYSTQLLFSAYFRVAIKIGYIICEPQWKMKMQGPLLKYNRNKFEMKTCISFMSMNLALLEVPAYPGQFWLRKTGHFLDLALLSFVVRKLVPKFLLVCLSGFLVTYFAVQCWWTTNVEWNHHHVIHINNHLFLWFNFRPSENKGHAL